MINIDGNPPHWFVKHGRKMALVKEDYPRGWVVIDSDKATAIIKLALDQSSDEKKWIVHFKVVQSAQTIDRGYRTFNSVELAEAFNIYEGRSADKPGHIKSDNSLVRGKFIRQGRYLKIPDADTAGPSIYLSDEIKTAVTELLSRS